MEQVKLSKEMITIGDVRIYCEYILNGKPPIVLIHGFVSSTYTFYRLIPLLEKHYSIIAIDLPGFGRSEKSTAFIYSYSNYAAIVAECIQYFKLREVCIIGHSMGGQIALNTAIMIPNKIRKLVLLCSSGYLKSANKLLIYSSYLPLFNRLVELHVKRKNVKENLQNVFYNHALITDDHIREFSRPLKEKDFYKSMVRLLRYREGDLTTGQLQAIQTPTLLIWGEEDRVVPVNIGKRLVKDLPNADLVIYKETGHFVSEERTTKVYHQVLNFLGNNA
ncbi:alpha/beta fold hydrolase [Oceanobacillus chungangensis]|uniref:Alpha/beta hydrolase n=1 Tax=Oceanobacillus chungangensis TaxID=1229152 RepID=A0A3D8PPR5_9BACI|nr:alpha/beta hydrolase [Oceanobacillus chungangensis]RDW17248.1 alpha/beta hydrolase [Oceanobacillus chungangensis]